MRANLGHEKDLVAVAARQRLAHPLLRAVVIVLPGIVTEINSVIHCFM